MLFQKGRTMDKKALEEIRSHIGFYGTVYRTPRGDASKMQTFDPNVDIRDLLGEIEFISKQLRVTRSILGLDKCAEPANLLTFTGKGGRVLHHCLLEDSDHYKHAIEVESDALAMSHQLIKVQGIDKELVGRVAADIRKLRPPEPYKGKGIRYLGEYVRRKAGKAGKVT